MKLKLHPDKHHGPRGPFHPSMLIVLALTACSSERGLGFESDDGALAACEVRTASLPPSFNLVPKEDPEPALFEVRGTGTVSSQSSVEFGIEVEGCCDFGLQRVDMPALLRVGEELEVSARHNGAFNPDWGITVRRSDGSLRLFAYSGRPDAAHLAAIDAPVDVEVEDLCSGSVSCHESSTQLTVTVTSDRDSVSLAPQQRTSFSLEGRSYQVLNYFATRFGASTGHCVDASGPGEQLDLQIVPTDVPLGQSLAGAEASAPLSEPP
jgi:hypothetical protein